VRITADRSKRKMSSMSYLLLAIAVLMMHSVSSFRATPFMTRSVSAVRATPLYSTVTDVSEEVAEKVIIITAKAMAHISDLKTKQGLDTLRMGVRSGGCSGMSYVMDFIVEDQITEDDHIELYDDVKCVVDPKSLLYLYGLQLDYSDELIGGGFKFSNPNAETAW
jgi:iron-sulfur cluster assembly accessory protein